MEIPKVRRYMVIGDTYGGFSLACEFDKSPTPVIIGSVRLPQLVSSYPGSGKESSVKTKERTEAERKFCEQIVAHLNAGLSSESVSRRMETRRGANNAKVQD